ncbi:MAG: family 16 glycoside hydrolase [Planctomycetaceae bacterium]
MNPLNTSVPRRRFLQLSAFGLGAAMLSPQQLFAAPDIVVSPPGYGGFKVGLQSYSLRAFSAEEAMAHTRKLGVAAWEAYPKHVPMSTVPSHIKEQLEILANGGIKLMSYGVVGFDGNENKAREIFDFAHAMGLVSISADPNPDAATFDMLDKLVEEYKIPIAIHNHGPGHRYDKVDDVLKVVSDRHPLIGACVDTGHYLRSNEDPVEVIAKLGKRVFGVHLKDVRTILDDAEKAELAKTLDEGRVKQMEREGKIFTILGEGELNVVGVLRLLRELGYDRNISLEYEENPQSPLSDIELCLKTVRESVAYLDDKEEGFVQLWDGKTFDNWKVNENHDTWKIENGMLVCNGERSHIFYTGSEAPYKDFELKVDVKANPNSNAGIYFHTQYQDSGWPKYGFEAQVNNTYNSDPRKTGSLYAVQDVTRQTIPDNIWWTEHIIVQGKRVVIKIDGKTVVDYVEPEGKEAGSDFTRVLASGTFALQGHDPGSTVYFRNIRAKKLS